MSLGWKRAGKMKIVALLTLKFNMMLFIFLFPLFALDYLLWIDIFKPREFKVHRIKVSNCGQAKWPGTNQQLGLFGPELGAAEAKAVRARAESCDATGTGWPWAGALDQTTLWAPSTFRWSFCLDGRGIGRAGEKILVSMLSSLQVYPTDLPSGSCF
jgi:hypothetical protein